MRRVVYFVPDSDAGVTRVVKNLLLYRPESNIKYTVVLYHQTDRHEKHSRAGDDFKADEIIRFNFSAKENSHAVYRRLKKIFRSDKDIIVANDRFELNMVVSCKLKNPVAYIVHGDFDYYYNIISINKTVIDAVIAISNKIEQNLLKLLGAENKNKVLKIYYPAAVVADILPLDQRPGSKRFTILFAGTIDKRKGADILYDIYQEITNQGVTDFLFEIIGEGVLYEQITTQFKGNPNVVISGWSDNDTILKKMSVADVFLFPSTQEGLPNVLIEALSRGAVPVSSNLESGVRDIIENEVNGILVEVGNIKGFANSIIDLYHNGEKIDYLKRNSRINLQKFSPYIQAAKYEEALLNISTENIARNFPEKNNAGRFLNKPWLPNWVVKSVRAVVKHPKL